MFDIFLAFLLACCIAGLCWAIYGLFAVKSWSDCRLEKNRRVYEFRTLILKMSHPRDGVQSPYHFLPSYHDMLESDCDLMDMLDGAIHRAAFYHEMKAIERKHEEETARSAACPPVCKKPSPRKR